MLESRTNWTHVDTNEIPSNYIWSGGTEYDFIKWHSSCFGDTEVVKGVVGVHVQYGI